MKKTLSHSKTEKILLALMLVTFAVSCVVTSLSLRVILDSDVSGEMVYSHHLQQTGQFLADDWYYSTSLDRKSVV